MHLCSNSEPTQHKDLREMCPHVFHLALSFPPDCPAVTVTVTVTVAVTVAVAAAVTVTAAAEATSRPGSVQTAAA